MVVLLYVYFTLQEIVAARCLFSFVVMLHEGKKPEGHPITLSKYSRTSSA